MATLTALNVAKYFLASVDEESGDNISNLKLQKLLYYAQGFHLAVTGKPLFSDAIVAWEHGPVIVDVYHEFKSFGANGVPREEVDPDLFSPKTREVLDEVFQVYGQFSAWKLRDLTHQEPPWKNTRKKKVISKAALAAYFKTQLTDSDG